MPRTFKQVDVFTKTPFKGNAVAVFFDADDLTTEQMQQIANWTNLSETTFIVKPTAEGADYKLRIFTTINELPFAGHPTLGSCHALIESGIVKPNDKGEVFQECGAGVVPITINDSTLTFKLPYYKFTDIGDETIDEISDALGISVDELVTRPKIAEVGPKFIVTHLKSGNDVLNLNPNLQKVSQLQEKFDLTGIQTFGMYSPELLESRTFTPIDGVNEDFACGSGAGAIGSFILSNEISPHKEFIVKQGARVQRDAELNIKIVGDSIYIGGSAVTCLEGKSRI